MFDHQKTFSNVSRRFCSHIDESPSLNWCFLQTSLAETVHHVQDSPRGWGRSRQEWPSLLCWHPERRALTPDVCFLTSWYYLTLLGRSNSTKGGGAPLRWLHKQLGWDGSSLARGFWVALEVESRMFPPPRLLPVLTSGRALLVSLGRRAGMWKREETAL